MKTYVNMSFLYHQHYMLYYSAKVGVIIFFYQQTTVLLINIYVGSSNNRSVNSFFYLWLTYSIHVFSQTVLKKA